MTEKLKPCPFCGGEARLQKHERVFIHGKTTRAAYVRCLQCDARTERVPYEEFGKSSYSADAHIKAVNAWNRRDADKFLKWLQEFYPNSVVIMSGVKNADTIIEAEVSE